MVQMDSSVTSSSPINGQKGKYKKLWTFSKDIKLKKKTLSQLLSKILANFDRFPIEIYRSLHRFVGSYTDVKTTLDFKL